MLYDQIHRDYGDAWTTAADLADGHRVPSILLRSVGSSWRVTTDPLAAFDENVIRIFRPSAAGQLETAAAAAVTAQRKEVTR